ncbi:sigma-54 interaction domain-containing protein [Chitinophaga parva]|nr:sigma 54-interacting transcriptional regulator [Chitinophaga parva]
MIDSLKLNPTVAHAGTWLTGSWQQAAPFSALTRALAGVQSIQQLHALLRELAAPLLTVEEYAIFCLQDNRELKNIFTETGVPTVRHSLFKSSVPVYNLPGQPRSVLPVNPAALDFEQLLTTPQAAPFLEKAARAARYTHRVFELRTDEDFIGICIFSFKNQALTSNQLYCLDLLTDQVTSAITRIMARQELSRQQQEMNHLQRIKSTMLSFAMELRSTRDVVQLSAIIRRQLHVLFGTESYLITSLSDNQATQRLFFYDHEAPLAQQAEFAGIAGKPFPVLGYAFRQVLQQSTPVPITTDQLCNALCRDLLDPAPDDTLMGAVLRQGEVPVGIILFTCNDPETLLADQEVFDNVLSQLAMVMTTIQAHQQLEARLQEASRSHLVPVEEKIYLPETVGALPDDVAIVGESPALKQIFQLVSRVAPTNSTVLLYGETGTGKELIAKAIHHNSPRRNKIMVKVNCAAIPANLIESELFGHERGAFTGATDRRIGKFELANGGTLFLDEMGEMPLDLQVKLLRVLQEKEIERVGGKGTIRVDVRIIAATNRDLEAEMQAGRFRPDLYYRLNIFPITLPPLRERKEDIAALAKHFINKYNERCGKSVRSVTNKVLQELAQYSWPGNVREMEHLIERSVLLATGDALRHVPLPNLREQASSTAAPHPFKTLDENEREHIFNTLRHCHGRIAGKNGAAEILGVPPTTLNSKMKRLGIKRGHTT